MEVNIFEKEENMKSFDWNINKWSFYDYILEGCRTSSNRNFQNSSPSVPIFVAIFDWARS